MNIRRTEYLRAISERLRDNSIVSQIGTRQAGKTALVKESRESLAGRVSFIDVTGFSLGELHVGDLARLWWRGGFPRAYLAADNGASRQWHDDFRRTFLERDIPQLGIQVPAATLGRFWTMVAHYHGQVLNQAELARAGQFRADRTPLSGHSQLHLRGAPAPSLHRASRRAQLSAGRYDHRRHTPAARRTPAMRIRLV